MIDLFQSLPEGALLIGYYENGNLIYVGKVGTGYTDDTLRRLADRLHSIERKAPPFTKEQRLRHKGTHWVQPQVVVQVAFAEWTGAGKLRHPRFLGVRRDKNPQDVTREKAG